jgi:hypothetical protein
MMTTHKISVTPLLEIMLVLLIVFTHVCGGAGMLVWAARRKRTGGAERRVCTAQRI